ncbi:MAG TPA: agmatine deiminase [Solirubrobacterales bacterium]|jgi:agmatine deiminase
MSTAILDSTPKADGFRMPGEFEPHAGCWMLWPERADNWRREAGPAQAAFAAVAAAIAAVEPVTVGASAVQLERARAALPAAVRVVELAADDAWMRDVGPTFVVDGEGRRRGVDWRFNAWGGADGGLYHPWDRDERVAAAVLAVEGAARYRAPLILEGGSIHVDGEGTVLTTEECLLNRNRNPELSREQIERHLLDYLGAGTVLWLGRGVFADETDGHVDNLACFARPGVVLLSWTDDPSDPQHEISVDARRRLEAATDTRGRPLEVVLLPSPGPLVAATEEAAGVEHVAGTQPRRAGDRLAGSYVNFYLANGRLVMPLLDERHDEEAAAILRETFPGREVVGVPAREILLGGGNVHCITQQVPTASSSASRPGEAATRQTDAAREESGRDVRYSEARASEST